MKSKPEKDILKGRKTPNGPNRFAGLVSPKEELVERAELNKLTSANLYKLLQHKKVQNRSKLTKKMQRLSALVGIITYEDLEEKGFSISERDLSSRPEVGKAKQNRKTIDKNTGKGVRFISEVGGIDVHRSTLVVAIANNRGIKARKSIPNDEEGIRDLIRFFTHHRVSHCALESTAEYWLKVFWLLTRADIKVLVANPLQTKTTQGKKTDKEDADRIALAFRDGRLKPSVVCNAEQYSMRKLNRAAFKKTQQATASANRLKAMEEMYDAPQWISNLRKSNRGLRIIWKTLQLHDERAIFHILGEEYSYGNHKIKSETELRNRAQELSDFLTAMDISPNNRLIYGQHIEDYVNAKRIAKEFRVKVLRFGLEQNAVSSSFKTNLELLLSVPGVGIDTALTILVEMVDIGFFWNSKGLARWAGLAPNVKQSGYRKRKNGHIYKGGNKWLRTAVWLAAKSCYIHLKESDEPIGSFIKRLYKERNKHFLVAVTAGARKLLTYIYYVLKGQKRYEKVAEFRQNEQRKARNKGKLAKLHRLMNNSTLSELLPLLVNSLKREQYKLTETEKELAFEMACNLNVIPKGFSPDEFG
ncbi:MAG: IS110 family transposase [Candidatus Cloacimonetes bacterium]|nr:IS110 family transposase [Candidatus Cloacimonadota bacterium]